MIKDAVLFSYDTLDVETTTELVLHYSKSADENGKRIMVLDVHKFCSNILGIEDALKLEQLQILASRSEPNYQNFCEDKSNYFLEASFWHNFYYFKWNRLKCSIRKFHLAKASTLFLLFFFALWLSDSFYFEVAIGEKHMNFYYARIH